MGFHVVHEKAQQVLTPRQMVARVSFAKTHLNNSWHYVLLSDEKLFELKVTDTIVWIRPGQQVPARQVPDVRAQIMVWRCVWWNGRTELCITNQSINAEYYTNILNTYLLHVMPRSSRYLFQQGNATPHKVHHTQNLFLTNKVRVLPNWPAHSLEFNAIE